MTQPAGMPRAVAPDHELRGVLRVPAFRKLWAALSLSSFGDWLGLLALTAMAPILADGGYAEANIAIAAVFILRLAPAALFGPLGGVLADRLDRRWTMVVCDLVRCVLFVSIPLVGTLWWLLVATLLIEVASLVWIPAKEATLPNLVPRERLETANQLSLFMTYGTAPVAAAVFSGLALLTGILDNAFASIDAVDLALFVNAVTFLVSALTIARIKEIPARDASEWAAEGHPTLWRALIDGWKFAWHDRLVRGLVVGMLGAFAAGGAVIGLARTFVADLGGGDPGYGLLFGTVFCGLAAGMMFGPRLVPGLSRRRLFALSICAAGVSLAVLALIPNMVVAVLVTFVIGGWAGVAWVTGYTLLGLEVADEMRGRTFSFVQVLTRVVLVLVLALAPLLAAAFGQHEIELTDAMSLTYNGAAITMLLAGLLAAVLGVVCFRQVDDRRGVHLYADLVAAYRDEPVGLRRGGPRGGFLIAFEGGEGAGKSTQVNLLADWLRDKGHEVVLTLEPGATEVGRRLRSVLLDDADLALSPRTEALLFAADRAEHVTSVIVPALRRGAIVVTDRYVDSSTAYQGAGRELVPAEVVRLSRWATDGLKPDLTVLLDVPAEVGLGRVEAPDKLESEPVEFHTRVRERYLEIARRGGQRYLVLDATRTPDEIAADTRARLEPLLPLSRREQEAIEAARRADEERRRLEEEERARREAAEAAARAEREAAEAAKREAEAAMAAAERARREEERQAAEAAERARQAEERRIHHEERVRQRAAAHEAKALRRQQHEEEKVRRRAEAAAASAAAEAARARQAMEQAEARRLMAEEQLSGRRRTGEQGAVRADPREVDVRPERDRPPVQGEEPPTRRLSLSDELFGLDEDETIELPRVHDHRDDR